MSVESAARLPRSKCLEVNYNHSHRNYPDPMAAYLDYMKLVLRGLKLAPALQAVLDSCARERNAFFSGTVKRWEPALGFGAGTTVSKAAAPMFLTVHMRIESDWMVTCAYRPKSCLSPRRIAEIVMRKFSGQAVSRNIVVIAGLDKVSPETESVFDVWPNGTRVYSAHAPGACFSTPAAASLNYMQKSALELFAASQGTEFVGTSGSGLSAVTHMIRNTEGHRNYEYGACDTTYNNCLGY